MRARESMLCLTSYMYYVMVRITLLRTSKILAIDHDPSPRGRGMCLLEGGPHRPRCSGGEEKLHKHGRDGSNNCIKKQLILSKSESTIQILGGRSSIG